MSASENPERQGTRVRVDVPQGSLRHSTPIGHGETQHSRGRCVVQTPLQRLQVKYAQQIEEFEVCHEGVLNDEAAEQTGIDEN